MSFWSRIFSIIKSKLANNEIQNRALKEENALSEIDWSLIRTCYNNSFGIDLERLHTEQSVPSEFHTNEGVPLSIDDLDLSNRPIDFHDGISSEFKLLRVDDRNYLLGDNSCYPCSIVYENFKGYRWINILIIPQGNEITLNQEPNAPIKYSFYTLKLYEYFNFKKDLDNFLDVYIKTFQKNSWATSLTIIQLIIRSSLSPNDIFGLLKERKLLNPFQLAVCSIYFDYNISKEELYHSLLINNDVPLGITYLVPPNFRIKFTKSTSKMLDTLEFKDFIWTLDQEEIDQFFEINFLTSSIRNLNNYSNFISDILSIRDIERWKKERHLKPIADWKKEKLSEVNITKEVIQEYYKKVKLNTRNLENKLRIQKGFNVVGSLYQESLLFKAVSEAFVGLTIISQHSPTWLERQRFDIFIKEFDIAIEYNGLQHYEPVNYFGGEEGFIETLKRDEEKRRKCRKHNCTLIEVKYDEEFDKVIKNLAVIIKNKKSLNTKE